MPSVNQHLWQDETAVFCSIQSVQQCSVLSASARTQESPKTCYLDKFASQRRQACAVSKALFAVLSLVMAHLCSLVTISET